MKTLQCAACSTDKLASEYSKGQLRKGAARRCSPCIASQQQTDAPVDDSGTAQKNLIAHELAAKVVAAVDRGGVGVRAALYDKALNVPNQLRPVVTALVSEVLRLLPRLRSALSAVDGPWPKAEVYIAAVLAYEIVVRKRPVKGASRHPIGRAVWERREALAAALPAENGGSSSTTTTASTSKPAARLPRYARVNALLASVSEIRNALKTTFNISSDEDELIPGLLRLPPKTNLHGNELVESGKLILQDRASCLPALALHPPPGAIVMDACAAPGNKTTQLAGYVGKSGKVIAFERNAQRAQTLRRMVAKASGSNKIVTVVEADFTRADTSVKGEASNATMALVDPSCSGSGGQGGHLMHRESSHEAERAEYWERVRSLASSQISILTKALSFPNVTCVVYSTCSVHKEENEEVVAAVLNECGKDGWSLARCLPEWPTRGLQNTPHGDKCVRAGEADATHGFFVARFERDGAASTSTTPMKKKKRKRVAE